MLGELVQTTDGKWITRPLLGAPTGIASARIRSLLDIKLASDTAVVGTRLGAAVPAMPWCTGHRSTLHNVGRPGDRADLQHDLDRPPSTPWWRADPWGRDVAAGIGEADGADGGFARCENFPASGEDAFGWSPVGQTPRYEDTQRWADYRPMPLQTHP